MIHSSKRKIFLKENKRGEDTGFSEGMYQLACRCPSLSLMFRYHTRDARSCFISCLHKFICSGIPVPLRPMIFFVIDFNEAKVSCYGSGLFFLFVYLFVHLFCKSFRSQKQFYLGSTVVIMSAPIFTQ